jgi:hypothetical protein
LISSLKLEIKLIEQLRKLAAFAAIIYSEGTVIAHAVVRALPLKFLI